ncbi:MAG TPA: Crp/Fnr family transcriptional regulator [Mesorhizobium sp.]|jgi:CRP-like cAMP-binding protein|nr:Crp/Fnr family transcriptional regulator [Mesorhizobium sp.]
MAQHQQSSIRNRLLAAMSPEDFASLEPHLERVKLEMREFLHRAGDTITHVTFIEEGIVSEVAETDEGRFEVGMNGFEGLVGISALLGVETAPHSSMVQASGRGFVLPVEQMQAAMDGSRTLRMLLLRFVHAYIVQVSQTAHANAGYSLEARLARWVLMTHDRMEVDELSLTHEFLSIMLGTRRSGVTIAVQTLEGNGMIRATRGRITVLDREKLKELAGDAYGLAEKVYSNILQFPQKGDA